MTLARPPAPALVALLLGLALTTACGSTVEVSSSVAAGTGAGLDSGLDGGLGAGSVPGPDVGARATGDTTGTGAASGVSATRGRPQGARPGSSTSAAATARSAAASGGPAAARPADGAAVAATSVSIGFITQQDASNLAGSLGLQSLVGGDTVAEVTAVVADLNARGGILGRKVVPVFQDVRTSESTGNPAAAAEAACIGLTEDRPVFAAISFIAAINNDTMFACMQRHGVPILTSELAPHAAAQFDRFAPYFYGPLSLRTEDLQRSLVQRLVAQRWLTGWDAATGSASAVVPAKVGMMYISDDEVYARTTRDALRAAGQGDVEEYEYAPSLDSIGASMASAVLRFRAAGVTHLLVQEASALLFFTQAAESQGYRPRYGLSTLDGASTLLETGAVPARQFEGALGAGYLPLVDVGENGRDVPPGLADCERLMERAGQDTSSATALFLMSVQCDSFGLLKTALERGGAVSVEALRRGFDGLGSSFASAGTQRMTWAEGRYDGAAALQDFAYTREGGFRYTGAPQALR